MITRYDVISSRWPCHFWVKMPVFFIFLFSAIKVKLLDGMIQSTYLIVKHKKLPFIPILTWFLVLGKIQDGNHCCWRHKPPAAPPSTKYTLSCWENQRLSTYGKIVSKYCNMSKTLGRDSIHPPPPVPRWGYEFACTSEGYSRHK